MVHLSYNPAKLIFAAALGPLPSDLYMQFLINADHMKGLFKRTVLDPEEGVHFLRYRRMEMHITWSTDSLLDSERQKQICRIIP